MTVENIAETQKETISIEHAKNQILMYKKKLNMLKTKKYNPQKSQELYERRCIIKQKIEKLEELVEEQTKKIVQERREKLLKK